MDGKSAHRTSRAALALALGLGTVPVVHAASLADVALDTEVLKESVEELHRAVTDRTEISGYYDFEYRNDNRPDSPGGFRQHHLSLFAKRDWVNWRFFAELEWEDGVALEGEGDETEGFGEVKVEFAWIQYQHADWLRIRAGVIMIPQHWNVNHYPPVILSVGDPLMVRRVFPRDFAGVMAEGTAYAGNVGGTYRLYITNGQSSTVNQAQRDDNEGKAVGGRFSLHLGELADFFTRLDLGVSGYTEKGDFWGGSVNIYGFDGQINTSRAELLFEYAKRTADTEVEGLYVQPSVRVWKELRLFYRFDLLDNGGDDKQTIHTAGVNYRVAPNISLKLEVGANEFDDDTQDDYETLATAIAIFF